MRNLFRSLSVFLVLTLLFVFSCKQDVQTKQTKGDSQEGFLAEDFSEKEINSSYLDTRSLKDELVEALILNDYKLSESSVDEALVKYVLGPDVKTLPAVYKKDVQTLLKYTLSQIKRDSCAIEFDEDKNDEIIVKAFDFYIDGIDGFAIVSNDERLGALISVFIGDNANKEGKKSKAILEINALMNEIKKEWGSITFSDVTDVAQRAWGVEIIDKTRGFNDFLLGIEAAGISIGKAIGFEGMRWNPPVANSAENHILDEYMDITGNMRQSHMDDRDFSYAFHSAITEITEYALWREKIIEKLTSPRIGGSDEYWIRNEVPDLYEHISKYRQYFHRVSDDDLIEGKEKHKLLESAEKKLKECFDGFDKSVIKAYAPYRGLLLRKNFTYRAFHNPDAKTSNSFDLVANSPWSDYNEIEDYDAIYSFISAMLINESPVISYSYIDALGNKKTINNIWKYIKQLNPGLKDGKRDDIIRTLRLVDKQGRPVAVHKIEDVTSSSNVSMDVVRRILMHLKFMVMGGYDDKYINVYWPKAKEFNKPALFKAKHNTNAGKFVREFIKEKFGADIGEVKYQDLENEYRSGESKYDKINNILIDVANKFGYKLVTWKEKFKYGKEEAKYYYILLDLFYGDRDSKEHHEMMNKYIKPILDQKGIIISNCRWNHYGSPLKKDGIEVKRYIPITKYRDESQRGYRVLFSVKDYKYRYRNELNNYIWPCEDESKSNEERLNNLIEKEESDGKKKMREKYKKDRLLYYPIDKQVWGVSVGIVKDRDVPSISLPLKSKDGKALIDVIKNGKFNLEYENEAFKPKKKNSTNAADTTQINDGLITVTSADSDSNQIPFYPDPDSLEDLKNQRKNGGKKIFVQGERVSVSGKK